MNPPWCHPSEALADLQPPVVPGACGTQDARPPTVRSRQRRGADGEAAEFCQEFLDGLPIYTRG
jgi:hypothetical protein